MMYICNCISLWMFLLATVMTKRCNAWLSRLNKNAHIRYHSSRIHCDAISNTSKTWPISENYNQSSKSLQHVIETLHQSVAICLDVDSTVIREEGIDELARMKGLYADISALNTRSMSGKMLYHESLKQSLDLLKPSKDDVATFLASRLTIPLSPKVEEFVSMLHQLNKDVYLVSGGFTQLIEPVADRLQIPRKRIFAIKLLFHQENGSYSGYDETAPTSREHGKSLVIQYLIDNVYKSHTNPKIIMIGDGNNDLQAKPPAALFIGYGGNIIREHVRKQADSFVCDFQELIDLMTSLPYPR